MSRYPANIITKSPATPTGPNPLTGRAPGIWRMEDVAYWLKQGVWPDTSADGYWPYTSLLLSSTSLSNANNNLFVDSSGAFNPISRNGNTTQGSFTPYGSYWSNYFDGSGDYLTVPSNAALNFGTGDFTWEGWIYANSLSNAPFIMHKSTGSGTGTGWFIEIGSGAVYVGPGTTGGTFATFSAASVTTNAWFHLAITRVGTALTCFVNGTSVGTSTAAGYGSSYDNSAVFAIGGWNPVVSGYDLNGYISNVRVVKGTAVYTANFTPPAAPLTAISGTSLLTCQSNRFIDNSSNAFAITVNGNTAVQKFSPFTLAAPGVSYNQSDITNWSGYFDGSGDYLSASPTALSTGDFTFECWIYPTSTGQYQYFYDTRASVNDAAGFCVIYNHASYPNQISIYSNGFIGTPTITVSTNVWTHFALVRSGGSWRTFVNGVADISPTSVSRTLSNTALKIGTGQALDYFFTGNISNYRIVNGTAVYTSAFTPPTTNLTAISGTSLLTLQNAAFTDNSTNNFVITQNGNPTVTGNSPFNTVGYWSNYFDGTGDWLASSSTLTIGTGDFTFEAWAYLTGTGGGYPQILSSGTSVLPQFGFTGTSNFYTANASNQYTYATTTIPLNSWIHVAACRSGSTLRLFINGQQITSSTDTGSYTLPGFNIGGYNGGTANGAFQGYLSNIRVVNSALYTSNFTPSTTPLTAISGTSLLTCQNGRFIDNSTNNFTITRNGDVSAQSFDPFYTATIASNGGSIFADGTGDYLTIPSSPTIAPLSSAFTWECWFYPNSFVGNTGDGDTLWITSGSGGLQIGCDANTANWGVARNGIAWVLLTSTFPTNKMWNHIAIVRSGTGTNQAAIFLNGTRVVQGTLSSSFPAGSTNVLSVNGGAGNSIDGYVSNMRLVVGTAIYDPSVSTCTVPTAPQNPSANTTLLLNGMNAGIYDATTINDMETVGNAQVSTVQSKFGGSSMYFDGSGDYLVVPSTPTIAFGTGAFTVEGWVYVSAYSYNGLFSSWNAAATGVGVLLGLDNTGKPQFSIGNANAGANESITGASAIPLNTWTHLAATKTAGSGGTMRLFVDGVSVGTTTTTRSVERTVAVVGRYYQDTNNYYLNGYIDDLRVTNGVARYTANFTPPTQAFPTY